MKKRLMSILLGGAIVIGSLAGCGGSGNEPAPEAAPAEETVDGEEAAPEETEVVQDTAAQEEGTADGGLSGELTLLHYLTEDAKLQALDDLIAGFTDRKSVV